EQQPEEHAEYHPTDEVLYGHVLRSAHGSLTPIPERLDADCLRDRLPGCTRADGVRRGRCEAKQHDARDGDYHGSVERPAWHRLLLHLSVSVPRLVFCLYSALQAPRRIREGCQALGRNRLSAGATLPIGAHVQTGERCLDGCHLQAHLCCELVQ